MFLWERSIWCLYQKDGRIHTIIYIDYNLSPDSGWPRPRSQTAICPTGLQRSLMHSPTGFDLLKQSNVFQNSSNFLLTITITMNILRREFVNYLGVSWTCPQSSWRRWRRTPTPSSSARGPRRCCPAPGRHRWCPPVPAGISSEYCATQWMKMGGKDPKIF